MSIDANKLSGFIERVEGDHRPITADIFLTDYCNNKCPYCRFSHETGKYIKYEQFVPLLQRLLALGVKGVILTGGGEPTINPDFERICQHLDELGIAYGINTNFNVAKFVRPRFLKVSIDEGLSEAYKAHRGKDALEDVLDNVRRFVTWKQSNGISTRVGLQCVTRSVEQVTQFYSAVHSLDVDYIQFRPLETKGKNIDYSSILKTIEALSQKDKRIKSSFKYGFCGWRPSECFAYWASICVDVNGNVPYCCARPSEVVGNIFDEDILAKLAAYKPDMKQCESPCRLTGANAYVMQYQNDGDRYFV